MVNKILRKTTLQHLKLNLLFFFYAFEVLSNNKYCALVLVVFLTVKTQLIKQIYLEIQYKTESKNLLLMNASQNFEFSIAFL